MPAIDLGNVPFGMHSLNSFQTGFQRRRSRSLNRFFIHAGGIVVADLLFHRIPACAARRRFFENLAQQHLVVIRQLGGAPQLVLSGGMGFFFSQPPHA